MRTFAIINQKGGCGKTTTAISLAGFFAGTGRRTLLVDLDPQSHCAAGLAIPEQRIDLTIADAMLAPDDGPGVDPKRLLWRVSRDLDLAPSTMGLAALEAAKGDLAGRPSPERRLAGAIRAIAAANGAYDVCLIDCSPSIGLLAFNALAAADEVIIPVETGFFSLQGATKQVGTVHSLARRLGVTLSHHILATMHDTQSVLAGDLLAELQRRFLGHVIPCVIRYDRALREATSFGQPISEYAPDSHGAEDYGALARWIVTSILSRPAARVQRFADPELDATAGATVQRTGAGSLPITTVPTTVARVLEQPPGAPRTGESPTSSEPSVERRATPSRADELVQRLKQMQQRGSEVEEAGSPSSGASGDEPDDLLFPSDTQFAVAQDGHASFGVLRTPAGLQFRLPAGLGRSVGLEGDFNGWDASVTRMQVNAASGCLECTVPASERQVRYRLVVDGVAMVDPYNPNHASDARLGLVSVFLDELILETRQQ